MPKSQTTAGAAKAPSNVAHPDDAPTVPLELLRARADRLARAALESCRQHERCAALTGRDAGVDPEEVAGWLELTVLANRQVAEATAAYEKAAARSKLEEDDQGWRRQANSLWLAAREHVRRHEMGDRMTRRVGSATRSVEALNELHVAFELEASAILSLRQAAESYCHSRPEARA